MQHTVSATLTLSPFSFNNVAISVTIARIFWGGNSLVSAILILEMVLIWLILKIGLWWASEIMEGDVMRRRG